MKGILAILLFVCMLMPLAVEADEMEIEAQPVEIAETETEAMEYGEPGAEATLGWPAFTYFWGSFNYKYVVKREQLVMGLEFATNALPLGFNVYMWMDFSGPAVATYFPGDKPRMSNLVDHVGSFDIYWPLNSYGFLPVDWIDLEAEYNVSVFDPDNVLFGARARFMDIPALKPIKDVADSLSYPGGSVLNCSLYLFRTDGKAGHDNWMKFALFYNLPFSIAGVNCYTKAWSDIDISDPSGQVGIANHVGHGTWSWENTVGVNIWSHLWTWWSIKQEKYNYWSTGVWSNKNIVYDNTFGVSWEVLF